MLEAWRRGAFDAFLGPEVAEPIAGRLRAEKVGAIARYTSFMMVTGVIAALLMMTLVWNTPAAPRAVAWGFVALVASIYIYLRRRAVRDRAPPVSVSPRAPRRAIVNAAALGAIWGVLPLLVVAKVDAAAQTLIVSAMVGVLGAGSFCLAPLPAATFAFVIPVTVGTAAGLILSDHSSSMFIIGLLALQAFTVGRAVTAYSRQLATRLLDQIEHEKAARTDPLTGLLNRAGFESSCASALAASKRFGESFAVLSLDLDGLKTINDDLGHAAGDDFLKQAVERLRTSVRDVDAVARLGGDEFAILARNLETTQQAAALASRILRTFEPPFIILGRKLHRSVSIGVAFLPGDGDAFETVLEKSDQALYEAKRGGGGSFRFHQQRDDVEALALRRMEADLPASIEGGEFGLQFQPLAKTSDLSIVGFESLIRWDHPTLGDLSPDAFLPLAERLGRIHALSELMTQQALSIATHWPRNLRVAINLSQAQLRAPQLPTLFQRWLATVRLPAENVDLEFTEAAATQNGRRTLASLQALKALGVNLTLDDFGAGYSSLAQLASLPVDRIKIDRALVQAATASPRHAVVLQATIGMAHELGVRTIAAGVDTDAHLALVRTMGCDEIQGSLLGEPIRSADVSALLPRSETVAAA